MPGFGGRNVFTGATAGFGGVGGMGGFGAAGLTNNMLFSNNATAQPTFGTGFFNPWGGGQTASMPSLGTTMGMPNFRSNEGISSTTPVANTAPAANTQAPSTQRSSEYGIFLVRKKLVVSLSVRLKRFRI
jgi:hypothetical protein